MRIEIILKSKANEIYSDVSYLGLNETIKAVEQLFNTFADMGLDQHHTIIVDGAIYMEMID